MKICCVTSKSFSKNNFLINNLKKIKNLSFKFNTKKLNKNKLIQFLKNSDYAIIGLDKIDKNVLIRCPKLKHIIKYGVGLDNLNFNDCRKYGVKIHYSKGVNKIGVAELALGMMITLSRKINESHLKIINSKWENLVGENITNKKVGIIGFGNVGRHLYKLLKPFNCKVYVNDIKKLNKSKNYIVSSKNKIYKNCDLISLHIPYNKTTNNLITKKEFIKIKKNSIIVNTSRGGIINEEDLFHALKNKKIGGAGLDVFSKEPFDKKKFFKLKNILFTSHIGGSSEDSIKLMGAAAIKHLKAIIYADNKN